MAMQTPSPLAAHLSATRTARTTLARTRATAALYIGARPALVPIAAGVLRHAPAKTWLGAEDLAQDALVDALPALRRASRVPHDDVGVMRWLTRFTIRHLRTRCRGMWATDDAEVAGVLQDTSVGNMVDPPADDAAPPDAHAAFRAAYDAAAATLAPEVHAVWTLVVEQETAKAQTARLLGIDRQTVYNRLEVARAHLQTHLAAFAP